LIHLSENALRVLQSRYLEKRCDGSLSENPDQLFRRVAKAVAQAELTWGNQQDVDRWEDLFYHTMGNFYFLPNTPTLMNAGTRLNQLSACFVLPIEDTLESIFTTLKHAAIIQQSGGGTGFNFSSLRPKNDFVRSTAGASSGPVSFLKVYDAATEHVKQGGKRRGANMGVLHVSHPDIEEFIASKREPGVLSNFNLSVGISHEFMEAVEQDASWYLVHPRKQVRVKSLPARTLWNLLVESAWNSGDPGLIFLDAINKANPTPALGVIGCTNPCGEVPLLDYESCNLGSINLSAFVMADKTTPHIDWHLLEHIVKIAVRFLDNVIEVNNYLLPEIKSITLGNRKTGLGVMGWADALGRLFIPYDSDSAVLHAERVMKFISEKSTEASTELSETRGTFPNWSKSVYFPHLPMRNATRTSIAPTGSISIIANTSPSIEPWFALAYTRAHVLQNEALYEVNSVLTNYLQVNFPQAAASLLSTIKNTGTLSDTQLPKAVKEVFKTALEIDPQWHIKHQRAFQRYTDNAVSKTINLPESTSIAEVDAILKEAWKSQLKGITIFRNNSKPSVMQPGASRGRHACKVCVE
jgi:ribonucleoside-diphosphate reductase alpha chain